MKQLKCKVCKKKIETIQEVVTDIWEVCSMVWDKKKKTYVEDWFKKNIGDTPLLVECADCVSQIEIEDEQIYLNNAIYANCKSKKRRINGYHWTEDS